MKIGVQKYLDGRYSHTVIYNPDGKTLHHLYGKDVDLIRRDSDGEYMNVNKHGNRANEAKVKIYILTSILDDRTIGALILDAFLKLESSKLFMTMELSRILISKGLSKKKN